MFRSRQGHYGRAVLHELRKDARVLLCRGCKNDMSVIAKQFGGYLKGFGVAISEGPTKKQASKMIEYLLLKKGAVVVEKVPRQRF